MNPLLNNRSGVAELYKKMKNPNKILKENPQLQSILNMYNGNAKQAFYDMCRQRGVDPESILSQFR